jgi:hypothetical protein
MIIVILVANQIPTFPILKFMSFVIRLLANDVQSQHIEEHPNDIRSKCIKRSDAFHI